MCFSDIEEQSANYAINVETHDPKQPGIKQQSQNDEGKIPFTIIKCRFMHKTAQIPA